jgi:hypothetical protein
MTQTTDDEWKAISACLARTDNAALGNAVKEYVLDIQEQGWPGYPSRDVTGIRRFLKEIRLHIETSQEEWRPEDFR